LKVRRSPHLVAYWRDDDLLVRNYATRDILHVTPFICELLDICSDWTSLAVLSTRLSVASAAELRPLLDRLLALHLLERRGRRPPASVTAMARLDSWNPEAGFFHMATRDVRFLAPRAAARAARVQAALAPMPPVVKRYPRATSVDLPRPQDTGEFPAVLRARRTWRRFSTRPVSVDEIGTLLGLTSGIQQWVDSGAGRLALKTSPSGGARHAIETYLVARDVAGLPAGVYHYAPDCHALQRIRGPVPLERLRAYVPNSGYFANGSAMVFFTAMFERILWRYSYSRAYRAALVEAGHLCQTFCLTATWLGLAPYCVMGLADSLIEADLAIDGISESVLYAAGVGRPPARARSATLPRGTLSMRPNPRLG
jgi:SagB-type dehydrogenase family enzyme